MDKLYCDAIHAVPKNFNFSQGYGETWNPVYPDLEDLEPGEVQDFAEDYGIEWNESYGRVHCIIEAIQENDPDFCCPMMNSIYPIPGYSGDPSEDQVKVLNSGSLCLVEVEGEVYLALTGGGMDFSWEICAAYIALGYSPPLHFSDLPRMAGKPSNQRDQEVIEGCLNSYTVAGMWADNGKTNLDKLREEYKKQEESQK